jgi:dUTP pyrophosphatase
LTLAAFSKNKARHDGLSAVCVDCKKLSSSNVRKDIANAALNKSNIQHWIRRLVYAKRKHSKKFGLEFDLTPDYLNKLWSEQNGRCHYFGLMLRFGEKHLCSAHLERLDSKSGYVENNVVWSSKIANLAKNDADEKHFREVLSQIRLIHPDVNLRNVGGNLLKPLIVRWKKIHPEAVKPTKGYEQDGAYDVYGVEGAEVAPGDHINVGTGLAVEVGEGWSYDLRGRSGLSRRGIQASLGLCDAFYQGEIRVVLTNFSKETYIIQPGDRIGQLKFNPVFDPEVWEEVAEFEHVPGTRGANGWGSSGR